MRAPAASSPAVRAVMRANRSRDTGPELALRRALHAAGLRFRVQLRVAGSRPDVVFTRRRVAVFVDGCFWHGCPEHHRLPTTNTAYWSAKASANLLRDIRQEAALAAAGWRVVRVWEHLPVATQTHLVLAALMDARP